MACSHKICSHSYFNSVKKFPAELALQPYFFKAADSARNEYSQLTLRA